jgi:proline iminopeptidase
VVQHGPGASGRAPWDRTADLPNISVPTLVIGARHDTMDPGYMEMMASKAQRGTYLYCPDGSHLAMYDDQVTYFAGIVNFIRNVERDAIASE